MAKLLDQEAIDRYRGEGYCFPIDVLDARETAASRARLEAFEATQGQPIHGPQRSKSHLLFKWVDDLMRHPRILDAVEDLIGADLLCWNTIFWIKEANSPSFVSWHQDARYWGARHLRAGDRVASPLAGDGGERLHEGAASQPP